MESIQKVIESTLAGVNARSTQVRVMNALSRDGWKVRWEKPVKSRGDGHSGRIDIIAVKDGKTVAIEVDRNCPRQKSIAKLNCGDWIKVIALRSCRGSVPFIPGIHVYKLASPNTP